MIDLVNTSVDVNLKRGYVIAADQVIPIIHGLDEAGDECPIDEAVSIVAGPMKDGYFLTISVHADQRGSTHH